MGIFAMRSGQENFYVDPVTRSRLTLHDRREFAGEIVEGVLVSESGNRFEIREGIPDFVYPFELPEVDRRSLQLSEDRVDAYDRYLPLTFQIYGAGAGSYRIGYATSSDGRDWTRYADPDGLAPTCQGWNSTTVCYPSVIVVDGRKLMFYNGDDFGTLGIGCAVLEDA